MNVSSQPDIGGRYREFHGVRFEPGAHRLVRDGRALHLAPREAAVLGCLLDAPRDATVSRRQLMDRVWTEGTAGDEALTVVISRLRRHLGELGLRRRVITTVPKAGYSLAAEPQATRAAPATGGSRYANRLAVAAAVMALTALVISLMAHVPRLRPAPPAVAQDALVEPKAPWPERSPGW